MLWTCGVGRAVVAGVLMTIVGTLGGCAGASRGGAGEGSAGAMDVGVAASAGSWATIGRSRQGRPILATTIPGWTRGGGRVLLIGGIHGDEGEGLAVVDLLVADLRERGASGRMDATVRVVRDMNPDGTAAGTRGNAAGVDLNRNWAAGNFRGARSRGVAALSEPETAAVAAEIERFGPSLVIVLHSARNGPFVNYDGPAVGEATAFAGAASRHDGRWRVVANMGYPTPGSLGTWMGVDRGIPILTVECARGEAVVWEGIRDGVRAVVR